MKPCFSASVAAIAILHSSAAYAEEQQSAGADAEQPADEIVVTGTAVGRSKLDAPFAISTISSEDIEAVAPLSSADLLKTVPGFSVEPSGGQGGFQNIYVRGLPAGGYFYVQVQEDGLTLFDEQQESFLNIDAMFAIDPMTQRVEVVRGGTSPIFANNANGGTVNLVTRRGTETAEGLARVIVGNRGFVRGEGYSSGPIKDNILYAVGGYYRRDDGFREPGYTADKGGQIRGSLSFLLGDVRLDVDAKYLNDRTAFYTPIPLNDPANPSRSLANLIDPLTGTQLSNDFRFTDRRTFFGNEVRTIRRDLADGLHSKVFSTGVYLNWDAGDGLVISNKVRFLDGDVSIDSVYSGPPPANANTYLANALTRARAGFGANVARVGFVRTSTGQAFDPAVTGGFVIENGLWTIATKVKTFANDFRMAKVFESGPLGLSSLSAGLYFSHFDFEQDRLQNTILTNLRSQPQLLDVVAYNSANQIIGRVTDKGFVRYGNGVTRGRVEGNYVSPYVSAAFKFGKLGIDTGFRYTAYDAQGGVFANTTRNLGDPTTLADDNVGGLSGVFENRQDTRNATQFTIGAEYKIDPRVQLFARYTASERLPRTQNVYQRQNNVVTSITQAEAGIRAALPRLDIGLVGFYSKFDDFSTTLTGILNPATGAIRDLVLDGQTRSIGVEAELNWRPVDFFSLVGTATLQDPTFSGLRDRVTGEDFNGLDGKIISRTPEFILTAAPTFYFDLADRPVQISAEVFHMGRRFVDFANSTALPAFTTLDLNLGIELTDRWSLRAQVSNVTNEIGLTEGNPRVDVVQGQGTANAIYGRPLFGRLFNASITYKW